LEQTVIVHDLIELARWAQHATGYLAADPTPPPGNLNPAPVAPPGLDSFGTTIIAWAKWILRICGIVGLVVCGIMMAVGRRQRSAFAADGAAGIPWVLGGLTVGAIAAIIVPSLL
jgi:hypothetical protein